MAACTTVDVLVRALGGEGTPVTLRRGAAVSEAKRILEDVLGIPTLEQRLLLGTSILDDEAEPFLDMAPLTELQVLRQPRLTLEQFRQELGHGETPFELNLLLAEAVRLEEPTVALEAHQMFDEFWCDKRGRSALHFAASEAVCRRLFAKGFSQVNALDSMKRSALHNARDAGVAKAILEHPDFDQLNARSEPGHETALAYAAAIRDDAMVRELLRHPGHERWVLQINIRDEAVAAHRLATFSGPFEALTIALQHVAENMQTEAETESDEFQNYAKVINFGEGKDWKEGGGWGYDAPPGKGSHSSHGQVSVFSSSGMATATGSLSMRLGGKGAGKHGQASVGFDASGVCRDALLDQLCNTGQPGSCSDWAIRRLYQDATSHGESAINV
eukprot:g28374.t1